MTDSNRSRWLSSVSQFYGIVSTLPHLEHAFAKDLGHTWESLRMESLEADSESARERQRVETILEGFDPKTSAAAMALASRFGARMTLPRLRKEAESLAKHFKGSLTPLERVHRRRKSVLLKWFDVNWPVIAPWMGAPDPMAPNVDALLMDDGLEWA
jgi:hypothetical protein